MCQLSNNISSKFSVIRASINTKQDSYEVGNKLNEFLGAIIQHHIIEFFSGDTNKGLEDFAEHTTYSLNSLKTAIRCNTTRLSLVAELETKQRQQRVKQTLSKKTEPLPETKLKETLSKVEVMSDKAIYNLGGDTTTTAEKLEIIATIPNDKPTAKQVQEAKKIYLKDILDSYKPQKQDLKADGKLTKKATDRAEYEYIADIIAEADTTDIQSELHNIARAELKNIDKCMLALRGVAERFGYGANFKVDDFEADLQAIVFNKVKSKIVI